MSKYNPLAIYFKNLGTQSLRISFSEIEKILGSKLPSSAYTRKEWWANDSVSHPQSKCGWLLGGWKVETIELNRREILFTTLK